MGKIRSLGILLLAANQSFAKGSSSKGSASPTSTLLSPSSTPTPPPCCFYQPWYVGLNVWWNSSVAATVATIITSVIQYDNTVITTSTTIQNANATYNGTIPTNLIGHGEYTKSIWENMTSVTVGWDNQVMVSPTPYVTVAQVVYMRGEIATDKTATATCTPVYFSGDPAGHWDIINPYVYVPSPTKVWSNGDSVAPPTGLIDAWISQTPNITEKYPGLTTCQPLRGTGQPQVHIPVEGLTDHSTTTVSMDGGGGGDQPEPTSSPAPTSEPVPSTTPEQIVTPDPTPSPPEPTSEPQPTENPPQSTGGDSTLQSSGSESNPPESTGGDPSPPQSSGGDSNQPEPTGGDPNPPQTSVGDSTPPMSTGGNTDSPQSSGGNANPSQSSTGGDNLLQSSGGDPNQPQPTGGNPSPPQSTGGDSNPTQSTGGFSIPSKPTGGDQTTTHITGSNMNSPIYSTGEHTYSLQSSGGDLNTPPTSTSAGDIDTSTSQPSSVDEPTVMSGTGSSETNVQVTANSTTAIIPSYHPATSISSSTGVAGEYTGAASPNKLEEWRWLAAAGFWALL